MILRAYNGSEGRQDNDRVEESAVNDGVVNVDVVHGDGILESPSDTIHVLT
jgi:hypothetical protein